jgi:hypothetical protein
VTRARDLAYLLRMKLIQITKRPSKPAAKPELDTRTPSGKPLKF